MAGVALAAGGFVVAAAVYIFGLEKYRPFARPAILTAFLGYAAVAVGLTYDLGLPWHIWHPVIYPQPRSVLFEVAACVVLYLTVLFLEFSPMALEHPLFARPFFQKILAVLKKATIPLVILGIVLSTLHQSSLGSLFLIAPYRVHPLWYSPLIWVLYLCSAIGLGLMMVTAESFFSAWLFGHKLRMDLLSGLGKAASVVLFLYAALRVGDLVVRGVLPAALDGSWQSTLFVFEIAVSAIVPAILLAVPRVRSSKAGLAVCSAMIVLGVMGYRFDTCIVTFARPDTMPYFPSWTEIAVSVGVVSGAMLIFIFFVQHLRVYPEEHGEPEGGTEPKPVEPAYNEAAITPFLPRSMAAPRRYSLALVFGAAVALPFLPGDVLWGSNTAKTPVAPVRIVDGWKSNRPGKSGKFLSIARDKQSGPAGAKQVQLYVINGNRNSRLVLFHHAGHEKKLGDKKSCSKCHHLNLPFHQQTACHNCHRDMHLNTDIFNHTSHIDKLGGNPACRRCHLDSNAVKNRRTSMSCSECHKGMQAVGSRVEPPAGGMKGHAAGYMDAMHKLCIGCHEEKAKKEPEKVGKDMADCNRCHMGVDASQFRLMSPYRRAR
jgi:Ni/Fe-hydrogenase subunit HybB-like protein